MKLTHLSDDGNAAMVNVFGKSITRRMAVASAKVNVNRTTLELIKSGNMKKANVLTTAQLAGIMAAKQTSNLIPLCHPVGLDDIKVELSICEDTCTIDILATTLCHGKTGVEMEAITAASVAAITIYDMCKAVQRDITITDIRLIKKSGGTHGDYTWEEEK